MQAEGSDRVGGPPPRRRPLLFAVIAVAVLVGLGWTVRSLLVSTDTRLPPVAVQIPGLPSSPAATTPKATATTPSLPASAPTAPDTLVEAASEAPPLPSLESSDAEVRATLGDMLPAAAQPALAPAELIRRMAVMADSFGRGKLLRDRLPLPAPTGKMQVTERDERVFLAVGNATRYDALTDIVAAMDPETGARWFDRYEPLLQEAWAELGNDGGSVRGAVIGGLDLMLAAPDLEGEIELIQPAVFYKYADPSLESLPDVQKLLIRVGPANRGVIKEKARRLRDALASAPQR